VNSPMPNPNSTTRPKAGKNFDSSVRTQRTAEMTPQIQRKPAMFAARRSSQEICDSNVASLETDAESAAAEISHATPPSAAPQPGRALTMSTPKRHRLRPIRSKFGPAPKFDRPEKLWTACRRYFEWVDANPLYEDRLVAYRGTVRRVRLRKMRAMTVGALCRFIRLDRTTWGDYHRRPGFESVTARVDAIIWVQKFEGAAAGLLNPAFIGRALGLADKSEMTAARRLRVE
jgi:hypothetical protein